MAYIRFDQDPMAGMGGIPMFTADGRLTTSYSSVTDMPQPIIGQSQFQFLSSSHQASAPSSSPLNSGQPAKNLPNIRNMTELVRLMGPPSVIDKKNGGIAIWSADALQKSGYGFLRRLEIIDESVPSTIPVKHFSNVYIWVHVKPSMEQLNNILSLSKDFFYDRKKELLIVRSDCLDTAVAQAALILLYTKGKITFYNLVSNDMLTNYYTGILPGRPRCRKVKKALYTILNTTKKMK